MTVEPATTMPVRQARTKRPLAHRAFVAGVALMLASHLAAAASPSTGEDIEVRVVKRGPAVIVDVQMSVAASARDAWDVLTDYEHMAQFVSNLDSSTVVTRTGNRLEVEQSGHAREGPITFSFASVRLVELRPYEEIKSHLLKGDFRSYDFTTRIVDHNGGVTVVNHGEYVPNRWVPPIVGPALIRNQTMKQYAELRAEILRRAAARAGAPDTGAPPR